ncbi:YkgJ family cysteine cluster protein [Leminorella grimontii]|uniref:YkgJ family cysteine cluster protein n=1 Tax=Leminorella grimontii TaxID=82981 RepID=UPI0004E40C51|nr:YkgJ family cysteine cluster protein [Leminorella grimontii]KFC96896.1 putative zinc- or iron-chelating protein [Leminorella grimontii ATCC 33999 = DSM 5078]
MECRTDCGACCIVPSISSPIPGMPAGKPANTRCVQLTDDNRCNIFGSSSRPKVCGSLKPLLDMCGGSRNEAMTYLLWLEESTTASDG